MTPVRIVADTVSIHLPIYNINSLNLKKTLLRVGTGGRIHAAAKCLVVEALRGVSFTAEEGDRIGLVGLNGAGKTTLLRAVAGIFQPTGGRLEVSGRVVPLLAVGVGMHDDATGYENLRNCALQQGMTVDEIAAKIDEIAAFTQLGDYLDLPTYTYSAGMRMRLGFAVATAMDADILALDEVIGAGDAVFVNRAVERFNSMLERTRIVLLATHDEAAIRTLCNKVLLLAEGRVLDFGPTDAVLQTYARSVAAG
jgi:ABC-type polysaccharide/polyol phosphate transport system ATPase subunit